MSLVTIAAFSALSLVEAKKKSLRKNGKGPSMSAVRKSAPSERVPPIEITWSASEKFQLSFSDLAFRLGLTQEELEAKANNLAELIELKRDIPCNRLKNVNFCNMVEELKGELLPKSKPAFLGATPKLRIRINEHTVIQHQKSPYAALINELSKMKTDKTVSLVSNALKARGCPRNLSAALMRHTELSLPDAQAKNHIKVLYKHASHCLEEKDEAYEITHFRYALLSHAWGNKKEAKSAIDKAILSVESEDRARVLYWAGLLQENKILQEAYWTRLVDAFPLTYHALEVWEKRKLDPLKLFASRPAFGIVRNALGADMPADYAMRWFEALYLIKKNKAALWLGDWITTEYSEQLSTANTLYISKLKSQFNTALSSIRFLAGEIRRDPMLLNEQSLRLFFPKHYFDSFSKSTLNVDPYLLLALARQESAFNPMARSRANAQGIMQILPTTARRLNRGKRPNLYNPTKNIELGSKFLGDLITRFGKVELALAAYNAGPNRIPQWQERYVTRDDLLFVDLIPYKETRNYVTAILRNNYWYERLYRSDPQLAQNTKGHRSRNVQRLISSHFDSSSSGAVLRSPTSSRD